MSGMKERTVTGFLIDIYNKCILKYMCVGGDNNVHTSLTVVAVFPFRGINDRGNKWSVLISNFSDCLNTSRRVFLNQRHGPCKQCKSQFVVCSMFI